MHSERKNMRGVRCLLLLLIALFVSATAHAQTLTSQGISEIDGVLRRGVETDSIPGVVAIVATKDRILYYNAFGLMNTEKSLPMQKDSIFRIASMTKPITSAAMMLLQEQGKVQVDDRASMYLPQLADREVLDHFDPSDGNYSTRKAAGPILIRHLLTHTAGFAYDFDNDTVNRLQLTTHKTAFDLPLLYDPGTKWTYSGSPTLLGSIVERVSGARLGQFFSEHFFKPLGMDETSYSVPEERHDRVVTVHQRAQAKLAELPNPPRIASAPVGEGGLFSTAADYVKFLQMLLNGGTWQGKRILSAESVRAMTQNQIGEVRVQLQQAPQPLRARPFPMGAGEDHFGFGFQITDSNRQNPSLRSPGSYSWAGINNTHFWVDPKRGIAAVILMQVLPFYDEACMKTYRDFEEAIGKNLRQ
jgi:CubicO group peptidase (beta-lactamase class C family)